MSTLLLLVLAATPGWVELAPGVSYRALQLEVKPATSDGVLHVVRVNTKVAVVDLGLRSEVGGEARTAADWALAKHFTVVINAGMFETDQRTNVGALRHGAHVNQPRWNAYQSVLLIGPKEPALPPVQLLDRDEAGFEATQKKYTSVVQNLRLIKGQGVSVWKKNGRRWSEALVGIDGDGQLLLMFCRTPYEMVELNEKLAATDLHVVRAMHVEGGPEASLSIHSATVNVDLEGSYETGFFESDDNHRQWALPNVLGVR